eukprot:8404368-Pyramimonas_sp.AAC.1
MPKVTGVAPWGWGNQAKTDAATSRAFPGVRSDQIREASPVVAARACRPPGRPGKEKTRGGHRA